MADWHDQKIGEKDIADGAVTSEKLEDGVKDAVVASAFPQATGVEYYKYLRPSLIMTMADDGDQTTTFTIQVVDGGGTNLAEQNEVHVWTSGRAGADLGVAVAIAGTFAPTTGVIMSTLTAKADFLILSDTNGTIVMDADDSQAGALYCMASIGGRTYSIVGAAVA